MSLIKQPQAYVSADRAAALLGKWKKMLDYSDSNVSSVTESTKRLNTAIVLENQQRWCNEATLAATGNAFGTHSTPYANGDARLPSIVIPMIRRTFPELIANEIVGVQPMSGPVGLAFAMRYKYEATPIGKTTANGKDGSLPDAATMIGGVDGTDGKELGYQFMDTSYTGKLDTDSFEDGYYSDTNFSPYYNMQMLDIDKGIGALLGDFEYSSKMGQVTTTFEKTSVEAMTRKLASTFSLELEADLRNMTGINIRDELVNSMSYELQAEIDRELVMRMIRISVKKGGLGKGWSVWSPVKSDGRWQMERARTLYQRIRIEAQRIAVRIRIGSPNFLVVTPTVLAVLEALPDFRLVETSASVSTKDVGVAKVGTLSNQFTVYRDMRTEGQYEDGLRSKRVEYILIGYKGTEYWNTGIVYCPYIPLMVQETTGPNDFQPRIGMFTRYGVVENLFGAQLFYHTIFIPDMEAALDDAGTTWL